MKYIKTFEGLSADKEEYTFATGDATSTDNLTYQASKSKDENAFVDNYRMAIDVLSKQDLSKEDEQYLRDFYKRTQK